MNRSLVTFCLITFIIYIIFQIFINLIKRRKFYKQASKFPGPPTLPIIGNAHLFIGTGEEIFEKAVCLVGSYTSPFRLWIGSQLLLYVNTPEQFKAVCLSPKTNYKGFLFDLAQPWLGQGIFTASGEKWRVHRKLVQPTFGVPILQSFVKVFSNQSIAMAAKMERHLHSNSEFEIYNYVFQCALTTICETTMGVDISAQTNGKNIYTDTIEKLAGVICRRVVSPWLHSDIIFDRTELGRDHRKYIKFLHDFTDNVIQARKKELIESQNRRSDFTDDSIKKEDSSHSVPRRKVLLDYLMELSYNNEKLSEKSLREEVDTTIAAGSETTAIVTCYIMLMLASYPDIQEKVYDELKEIFKNDDHEIIKPRDVLPEDLTRMVYLERVIKETMRLFPLAPFLIRTVTEDLEIGEHTFPKGCSIVLPIIQLHRNEEYWPDPLKFDPDRFMTEEVGKRDAYTYLPFSGGPRNCLGAKYAMMAMKTMIATILLRYVLEKNSVTPIKDMRFKWEFLLKPSEPITLGIKKRATKSCM